MGVLCRAQNRPRWKAKVLRGPEKLYIFWPDLVQGASIIIYLRCERYITPQ